MPASPHLERFTLIDDDDESVPVVALTHHNIGEHELVLLVPESAFDDPDPDMDAWVRVTRVDDRGERVLDDPPDELVDPAWEVFEDILSLTFAGDGGPQ